MAGAVHIYASYILCHTFFSFFSRCESPQAFSRLHIKKCIVSIHEFCIQRLYYVTELSFFCNNMRSLLLFFLSFSLFFIFWNLQSPYSRLLYSRFHKYDTFARFWYWNNTLTRLAILVFFVFAVKRFNELTIIMEELH